MSVEDILAHGFTQAHKEIGTYSEQEARATAEVGHALVSSLEMIAFAIYTATSTETENNTP
jgi:hypothetical protein